MITRLFLFLLLLQAASVAAPTVGQVEVRIYGSGGYVPHPLTWENGQVIMKAGGVPTAITLDKAAVSLGNVENTALSTWPGSTNLTTVGAITTGTWNATAIALGKIAQGGATSGQALTWDGSTWAPATIESSITIGDTEISGGTSGRLLTSGSTVGEMTLGTGVSAFLNAPTKDNADSMLSDDDFAYRGTAQTFSAVQTVKAVRLNTTDGAYLRDGYEATGDMNRKGSLYLAADAYSISLAALGQLSTSSHVSAGGGYGSPYYSGFLVMPANSEWDFRNGTSAVAINFYRTWSSSTNFEGARLFWSGAVAHYKPVAGAGGGTIPEQRFWLTGTVWIGSGSGSPEGVETAGIGSIYTDTSSGSVYRKTSGSGNTGWVTP
jgi:hypothetical protein